MYLRHTHRRAYISGLGRRTIVGGGMRLLGETRGRGMVPAGRGMVPAGGDIFSDIGKFITSKPVRKVIRGTRRFATPFVKTAMPWAVNQGLNLATSGPLAGLKPLVPFVAPIATEGALAGVDALNRLAETRGFGVASNTAARVNRELKKTIKRAKTAKLDSEAAKLLDSLLL